MKGAKFEDPSCLVEKIDSTLFIPTEPPIGGIYDVSLPESYVLSVLQSTRFLQLI